MRRVALCGNLRRRGSGAGGRVFDCHSSPSVDPATAEATADTLPAAERVLVWLRRNALGTKQPASRACRQKRSRNFRRRGASARVRVLLCPHLAAYERPTQAARRVADAPPEALADSPPAWIERARAGRLLAGVAHSWSIQPSPKRLPTSEGPPR
jgi:hypothetical protein